MDRELLLEIGVEEMPASWLPGLTTELAARLEHRLTEAGLPIKTPIESHSTPRRLAACAPELVDRQEDRDETVMGPAVSAAFDAEGHPTNAGLGFARKLGVDFDALLPGFAAARRQTSFRSRSCISIESPSCRNLPCKAFTWSPHSIPRVNKSTLSMGDSTPERSARNLST